MRETFRTLINRTVAKVPNLLPSQAKVAINERYAEIVNNRNWTWLSAEGVFQTVDVYSTGSVEVTQGLTSVTGIGTTFTSDMTDRIFRVGNDSEWYKSTYVDATHLTLDVAYEGTTNTSAAYKINKNIYSMASDMNRLQNILSPTYVLEEINQEWLAVGYPDRSSYGAPLWYSYSKSSGTTEEVELFPIPNTEITFRYYYKKTVAELSSDSDQILQDVNAATLVWGAVSYGYANLGRELKVAESNAQVFAENQYQIGLARMVKNDILQAKPERIKLADVYTQHRRQRVDSDLEDNWAPWQNLPY